MKKSLFALTAAALILAPGAARAQGFAVAGRAGTLGIGAEAALGLGPRLDLRGGIGLLPIERDAGNFWDTCDRAGVDCTFKLPKTWYNIGLDLYVGGGFRIGGGMLFKPDDPSLSVGLQSGSTIEVGGVSYTEADLGTLTGSVDSKSSAPYALIGFGKHTKTGIGLFLDLGMAFLGDSPVKLEASADPQEANTTLQANLRKEEATLENDLPTWARKYWPILNVGIKVGIGR